MKPPLFFWVLAFGAILIVFLVPDFTSAPHVQDKVCFQQDCFQVELALTPEEQSRGLMYRQSLGQDCGMLFVFQREDVYPFWMKNTLIPLDIIWMDSQGSVVFIKENAQPCGEMECPLINPGKPAKYVLEVNGGTAGRIGLLEGERGEIQITK